VRRTGSHGDGDYSGIENLAILSGGDYRSLIELCGRMISERQSLDEPIPHELQNRVIRDYSVELVRSLGQGVAWGNYVAGFLESFVHGSKQLYPARGKAASARRICMGFEFVDVDHLSADSEEKLLWLIRSGVIETSLLSARKGKMTQRFVVRRMFFPAFEIPISETRDVLLLNSSSANYLLQDPSKFWQDQIKRKMRIESSAF